MPSLSKGETVTLKRHHIIWKTKLKFCSNVPNTASTGSQIFYTKAMGCGKMIQHKYYGSAFNVAEHMYLSNYVHCMYNYCVVSQPSRLSNRELYFTWSPRAV